MPAEPDFIVVGAGAAGSALAGKLSADPATSVLLLEAGPPDKKLDIRIPAAFPKLLRTQFDWGDDTVPQPELGDREIAFPLGRGLGGSTSINAQMYVRGHRSDFDEWGVAAGPEWGWEALLPHFRSLEGNTRGSDELHGGDGPLHVSEPRDPNPLSHAFVAACEELGYPNNHDVNGSDQEGAGLVQVSQRKGRRWSAADAFIRRAGDNLEVRTGAQVLGLVLDGLRVTGVSYERDGQSETARAGREVVLCAGAIGTPHLLMCSGIGPRDHLSERGVEVRHDLPGVGSGLTDHPFTTVTFGCDRPVSLKAAESPVQLARYLFRRKGLLTSNIGEGILFTRTNPDLPAPDLELVFGPSSGPGRGWYPRRGTASRWARWPSSRAAAAPCACGRPTRASGRRSTPTTSTTRRTCACWWRERGSPGALPQPRPCRPRAPWSWSRRGAWTTRTRSPTRSARSPRRSTTRSAPAGWAPTAAPWSTPRCAFAGWRACAWRTRRSCRASPAATRRRRVA